MVCKPAGPPGMGTPNTPGLLRAEDSRVRAAGSLWRWEVEAKGRTDRQGGLKAEVPTERRQ